MKVIDSKSVRGCTIKTVELDEEEWLLQSEVLITMADGHSRAEAVAIYAEGRHPGHFGGVVTRTATGAVIKIYTD